MRSARGVPPGSRVTTVGTPSFLSHLARSWIWVDLPDPSIPSKVMKNPFFLAVRSGGVDTARLTPCVKKSE